MRDLESARARARQVRDAALRGAIERALLAAARQDFSAMVDILAELEAAPVFGEVPEEGFDAIAPVELESPELHLRPIEDLALELLPIDETVELESE